MLARPSAWALSALSVVFCLSANNSSNSNELPVVQANDNRLPAGSLQNGVLKVALVAQRAVWYPEAADGPSAEVVAFGEEGKLPQVPAPLIRVRTGTVVEATFRNALTDSTLWVHWFDAKPSAARHSVAILPGATHTVRFEARTPGTYMYSGTEGAHAPDEREQLAGAFIVDGPGQAAADRVFVINIWSQSSDSTTKKAYREALAINGKSWPHTEPLHATTGDTLRWRVVNASRRPHPIHLHGFYFRVDARGSALQDTVFAPDQQRLAVTEDMSSFSTMALTWVPDRPGNWIFHCHLAFHVVAGARLAPVKHHTHSSDPREHMSGLVLGIAVKPGAAYVDEKRSRVRHVNLFINEGKPKRNAQRAMSFVQQVGRRAPAADSVEVPGSMLVLTRGEPTDIRVTNRLREASAVHWHGIELESYSDGVAGISGIMNRVAPAIEPGRSFKARLTLPRAGTFIYHTHLNDIEQITSGLYGAIVVLEPGQRFDPQTDHVYVAGWDGDGEKAMPFIVNGDSTGPPRMLQAGIPHRFRFINIGPAQRFVYEIRRDGALAQWRAHAKDGADLPPAQARVIPSARRLDVGETFDAIFTPEPGEYTLIVRLPPANAPVIYRQRLTFRKE